MARVVRHDLLSVSVVSDIGVLSRDDIFQLNQRKIAVEHHTHKNPITTVARSSLFRWLAVPISPCYMSCFRNRLDPNRAGVVYGEYLPAWSEISSNNLLLSSVSVCCGGVERVYL